VQQLTHEIEMTSWSVGHHQTRSEGHGHYLGWSRRTGDRQSRMLSTCGQMHPSGCGLN